MRRIKRHHSQGPNSLSWYRLMPKRDDPFEFAEGRIVAGKYEILDLLGSGFEGEVYLVRELTTGIDRAAKFFYPTRNARQKTVIRYARKLDRLSHCPMVIGYNTQESMVVRREKVVFLVSEYVHGEMLSEFLKSLPGGRLLPFAALHLLYALCSGMAQVHAAGEFHGDLHTDNIMVERFGLRFHLKVLDLFHWSDGKRLNMKDDICSMIHVFYEALGGKRFYAKHPRAIKEICCGLKRSLILKKFRSAAALKNHLETMHWHY